MIIHCDRVYVLVAANRALCPSALLWTGSALVGIDQFDKALRWADRSRATHYCARHNASKPDDAPRLDVLALLVPHQIVDPEAEVRQRLRAMNGFSPPGDS